MPPIEDILSEVVSQLPGYEPREEQLEMARLIQQSIETGRHALVEAGTGSGKSFAYLIPLLESGKKVVISTGTIALQEQLLNKDLPFLQATRYGDLKVAIAKGRGNYICLRKLTELSQIADARLTPIVDDVMAVAQQAVWNGDRGTLPFMVPRNLWNEHLASDGEDCLGARCPNWGHTPHRMARIACDEADLIIANHALYFTDLVTGAGVLPPHDLVVFDEAQHLERAAVGALTIAVGRHACDQLLTRARRRFRSLPLHLCTELEDAEAAVRDIVFRAGPGQHALPSEPEFAAGAHRMQRSLNELADWMKEVPPGQMTLLDESPEEEERAASQRDQMAAVAEGLAGRWGHFAAGPNDEPYANWMSVAPPRDYFELKSAPLEIGEVIAKALWSKRTCVLTSATLTVDGSFDYLRGELGLGDDCLEAALGSPFDFERQAVLYLPADLPEPSDPEFLPRVTERVAEILDCSYGRAFVLFTSYRALREVSSALRDRLPYPSKTQEDLPRQKLLEWFRETPNSVLFATTTFWEGVDVPGEALSCVIIDKLPFASPGDPVVHARVELMKSRDEDWFGGYMLPRATLMLKQGFGRLIRSRTDTGMVALLDRRVMTRRYGAAILRSLPPARIIHELPRELDEEFPRLTPPEVDTT